MKKRLIIFAVIAALALGAFFMFRPKPVEVSSALVNRKDLTLEVEASGIVATDHQAQIAFLTSGKIGALVVHEGDQVRRGQFLASLDPEELQITQDKTLANWRNLRVQLDEFDRSNRDNAFRESIINLRKELVTQLEAATKDVESADTSRRKLAVYSPIAGVVTKVSYLQGENVTVGTPVILIDDLRNARFVAEVDEVDLSKVQIGQDAKVTLDAYSEQLSGKVLRIAYLPTKTTSGGTAFETTIALKSPTLALRRGLGGDVKIIESVKSGVLSVPSEAIITEGGKSFVYKVENDKAVKIEVVLGMATETEVELKSGLSEGERVITSDLKKLKDGQKIRTK